MGTINRTLRKSPNIIKNYIYEKIPFGYRYGKNFRKYLKEVLKFEKQDVSFLYEYQKNELKKILEIAFEVPYYNKIFNDRKITLKQIQFEPFRVLKLMPILTKNDIRKNSELLVHPKIGNRKVKIRTSGSTGESLCFTIDKNLFEREGAFQERAWRAHNSTLFFGKSIWIKRHIPAEDEPLYVFDKERQWLMLSPYHISSQTIKDYVGWMNDYRAPLLVGYPSSIYIFVKNLENTKLKLPYITSIHVASEKLLPHWRETIENVIGVSVKDHYGMMEKSAFFHQCSETNFYHESLDYGYTEILPNGEIFITGFLNKVQPFIKYQIGDIAVVNKNSKKHECSCGSKLPLSVKEFEGRTDDILEAPDGRLLPPLNFYTMFYKIGGIYMFSIKQFQRSELEVEIVPEKYSTKNDTKEIKKKLMKELKKRFGKKGRIHIKEVGEIERSLKTGKIRCISNLINGETNETIT